jgi:predicted nucleic acid-binding protein
MNYLLDTNICIYYFKGQFGLKEKIEEILENWIDFQE